MRIAREIIVNRFAYSIADKFTVPETAVIGVRRRILEYATNDNRPGKGSRLYELLRQSNFYDTFNPK
ncbi:MAG: hypothetical protein COT15_00015 [Candidatus Diapherotrites archaeon CG08_land_8_20_14_0_20_34_12]|nr:MAG: hypothetical protein COT15_00015 [Candidatus Diapherotrites archaeon CG08_land_8_20_14_0_20_34_12]